MSIEARQDLNEKLKLEAKLLPMLRSYNRRIIREFVKKFGRTGEGINAHDFDEELTDLLLGHYERTGKVFIGRISSRLPVEVEMIGEEKTALDEIFGTLILAMALDHSKRINETTNKTISRGMALANSERDQAAAEGKEVSQRQLGVIAGAELARDLAGREQGTVITETQVAAELAKSKEIEVLIGAVGTAATAKAFDIKKEWVSVGDNLVRDAHSKADSQRVFINEPFYVGGEYLMHPGDMSLGATVGNIINCRCAAITDLPSIIKERQGMFENELTPDLIRSIN